MTTRINREELLHHPVRRAILDRIREEPGIPFLGLFDRLRAQPFLGQGVGFGSLQYHLQVLEKFGHVTNRRSARHRRYYQNGAPFTGHTTALSILQVAAATRLAQIILAAPGLTQREVWNVYRSHVECTRQAIGFHLQRLADHGLVEVTHEGRFKTYRATARLLALWSYVKAPDSDPPPPNGGALVTTPMVLAVPA